ncbi:hypothetical protein PM082_001618 [Marasmius tenuissimus]|nr:hypothetical protein PM082_001618 [Marasmius tenuissimus]
MVDNSAALFNFTNSSLNYEYIGGLNDANPSEWPNFCNDVFVNSPPSKAGWAAEDLGYSPPDIHLDGGYPFPDSFDSTWNIDIIPPHDLPPQYSPPRTPLNGDFVSSNPPSVSPQHIPTHLQSVHNESAQPPVEHFNPLADFINQLPLIHTPTWTPTDKPETLIKAMQACGALYIRTPESEKFVSDVLKEGRENIMMDFARETDPLSQMYMALALVLIQTVGLFHQSADQRHSTAMYHAMVATIISRSTAFQKLLQWKPPLEIPPTASLDDIWHDWIRFESAKRVRCLLYLHDCCQSIYFATPQNASLSADLYLPSEPALWNARTAQEWYDCLQKPSLYGTSSMRLQGVGLQQAWSRLVEQQPSAVTTYTSAFGHYILVHCALARIYVHMHAAWDSVDQGGLSKSGTEIYTMQNVLQNWLLNWQCEMRHSYGTDTQSTSIPFAEDALPFYWLGQVSLLTLCEGKERQGAHTIPDIRFRVVKGWLSRIRECLRSNRTAHAQFTNELIQLRSHYAPVEMINVSSTPLEVPLNLFHPLSS